MILESLPIAMLKMVNTSAVGGDAQQRRGGLVVVRPHQRPKSTT